jgi:hypothetical protein
MKPPTSSANTAERRVKNSNRLVTKPTHSTTLTLPLNNNPAAYKWWPARGSQSSRIRSGTIGGHITHLRHLCRLVFHQARKRLRLPDETDIARPEHHAKHQAHPVLPHVRLSEFPNLQNLGHLRRHNRVALPVNQRKFATMRND